MYIVHYGEVDKCSVVLVSLLHSIFNYIGLQFSENAQPLNVLKQ